MSEHENSWPVSTWELASFCFLAVSWGGAPKGWRWRMEEGRWQLPLGRPS